MNVLSCFDGISCGQLALTQLNFKTNKYYASEIDKNAIKVTMDNFPNTIQLGDIKEWKSWDIDWNSIDLLFGGFCCQSFSSSGKGKNFNDERGQLFFVLNDILKFIQDKNPNLKFLFENVNMKKEWAKVITDNVGVEPILINSSLVSAQNRERLYWTNIKVEQPKDKGIVLKDVLEEHLGNYTNKATITGRRINERGVRDDYNKSIPITQCLEVRATNTEKSNCLTTVRKDNVLTSMEIGRHVDAFNRKLPFRYYSLVEYHRLQTLPDYYCKAISESASFKAIGNGWTVDVIKHILEGLRE